jgi:hypothetical protein
VAKSTLTVVVHIDGVHETLAAFRQMDKSSQDKLRAASFDLATMLAGKAQAAARAESGQAALLAPTVRAVRDRVPVVQAGGARRVGRKRAPAWGILFGSEFGMNARSGWYAAPKFDNEPRRQYKRHNGSQGYWFFPTVEENQDEIAKGWNKAADAIIRDFVLWGGR